MIFAPPVNSNSFSQNKFFVQCSPNPGVRAIVPIVSQHEIMACFHGDRAEIIPVPSEIISSREDLGINMFYIRFVLLPSVQVKFLILHLNDVSRNSNTAFYIKELMIPRIKKNNDFPSSGLVSLKNSCRFIKKRMPIINFIG